MCGWVVVIGTPCGKNDVGNPGIGFDDVGNPGIEFFVGFKNDLPCCMRKVQLLYVGTIDLSSDKTFGFLHDFSGKTFSFKVHNCFVAMVRSDDEFLSTAKADVASFSGVSVAFLVVGEKWIHVAASVSGGLFYKGLKR